MVRRRQCDAVSNMVGASGRSDRKDVRSINEPQLHAANGTPAAMCVRNLLPEIASPEGATYPSPGQRPGFKGELLTPSPVRAKYEVRVQSQT